MTVPMELARALEGIGRSYPPGGRPAEAREQLRRALAIYHHLGVPEERRTEALLRGEPA